jgi:hypothetical protein
MIKFKSGQTLKEKIAADREAKYQAYVTQLEAKEQAAAESMSNGTNPNAHLQAGIYAMLNATLAPTIAAEALDAANWKDIPGFEKYQIRADGTVRRKAYRVIYRDPPRFFEPRKRHMGRRTLTIHGVNGHRAVAIKANGKVKRIYVDAMVKKLFPEAE